MARDRVRLSGGELEPEPVLVGEHDDVREDLALGIGEEAVGPLARREALDVAGDVGVEEALAVRPEDLQPPRPGKVGQSAALAQRAVFLGYRHDLSLQSSAVSETVPFTVEAGGTTLHGIADLPDLPGERPAVVVCHGFKGFMEWGFFPYVASLLAERGFAAVRFNLSGAGMRP